jgi:hypothetical protein
VTCPTCHGPLPAGAFYGPCESCRRALQAEAVERAAWRAFVFAATARPESTPDRTPRAGRLTPVAPASTGPVGHCVHCNEPVYGPHAEADPAAHPCCVLWAAMGFDRCYGCVEARRLRNPKIHVTGPVPLPPPGQRPAVDGPGRPGAPAGPSARAPHPTDRPGGLQGLAS